MRGAFPSALLASALLACAVPPPSRGNVVTIPSAPSAGPVAPPPGTSVSSTDSGVPLATRSVLPLEIPLPGAACVVEADAPPPPKAVGLSHVYVGGVSVASVLALGAIRHVRYAFAEGNPRVGALAIDAEVLSARGAAPTDRSTTDGIVLWARTRVVRAGWLEYGEIGVASVNGPKLEPVTELPPWITPAPGFADTPFLVACSELTPFGARREEVPDSVLRGTKVTLEDASGQRLASIDAPRDGVPVRALAAPTKGRTKIRFELAFGRLVAEGWVASSQVKPTTWGGLGYGTGHGRMRPASTIACQVETPLRVRVKDATYAWGTLHIKQRVEGEPTEDGGFALTRLGGTSEAAPFVPSEAMTACTVSPP